MSKIKANVEKKYTYIHILFLKGSQLYWRTFVIWLGLEKTFKDHLGQPHCHGQKHLSLDLVAQSPVQSEFKYFP